MPLLDSINGPEDLRALGPEQLKKLAAEIRAFLIDKVSRTGGHLGPNLGLVEVTMALHRVFDSPADPIIFDVGHQAYVHKILTGRQAGFDQLRQWEGLSGYPSRAESDHDWVENSHASTALSYAEGMAKAMRLTQPRDSERRVVALVGDGAMTGGMAWEAINNIAADPTLPVVIVVNDNGRSYTPTVGGLANYLNDLRTNPRYEAILDVVRRSVSRTPLVGNTAYELLHGVKIGLKDILAPQGMFSDLGLKYVGPIDGHDMAQLERAFHQAQHYGGPVLVHCITHKGQGFQAALDNEEDQFHSVGKIDSVTGEPLQASTAQSWTSAFSAEMVQIGREHDHVVAVTAAMLHPTGLGAFAEAFPERTFDVGIAEQHAVTSAAGMAMAGLHPVVAIYSTFLNRAFDQLLMDVALHHQGVTLVLDRAGITGPDGPSHHGMWDCSLAELVPGLHLAQPRDATRLAAVLEQSIAVTDAPSVIRFSRDSVPADIPELRRVDGIDVLLEDPNPDVLVVGFGEMVRTAMAAAELLRAQGVKVCVVDPVWALPMNSALVEMAARHRFVVTIEDSGLIGGCGARLGLEIHQAGQQTRVHHFGIPQQFQPQGSRAEVLKACGLTAQDIARSIVEMVSRDHRFDDQVLRQRLGEAHTS